MQGKEREIEYWNTIADETSPHDADWLYANFHKRPAIARHILDYDFTEKVVLEIGTGLGILAYAMKQIYGPIFQYIGTDISDKFIEINRRIFKMEVVQASADSLPVQDQSVDFILAMDVLEHIRREERNGPVAAEFRRILKRPNGRVLINNPLAETQHDLEFDYGFSDSEKGEFAEAIGGIIERVSIFKAKGRFYQFISMVTDS